jgi:hypothetical protein
MKVDARATLRDRARVVGWGVVAVLVVEALATYLAQNHTGAVIAQLVVAEFATGRLGVAWSDPLLPLPTARDIARRALRGASLGGAAAVVLVGASVMFHVADLERVAPSMASLVIGLLLAALTAGRDELLLRGLVLRALGPNARTAVRLAVCGLAGVAWRFGNEAGVSHASLAFAFLSSVAFGALWVRDRGAWLAVGANATFMFMTGPLVHGAVIDVRMPSDVDASYVAVACGVAYAASAMLVVARPVRMPP